MARNQPALERRTTDVIHYGSKNIALMAPSERVSLDAHSTEQSEHSLVGSIETKMNKRIITVKAFCRIYI